jgi:molybdopterin converting factor small subunit
MAQIIIPTPLRKFTDNQARLNVIGKNVQEALQDAAALYPDLKENILDENNKLRGFVRVYVGDEDIEVLNKEATEVSDDSIISIIPAIAGGSL